MVSAAVEVHALLQTSAFPQAHFGMGDDVVAHVLQMRELIFLQHSHARLFVLAVLFRLRDSPEVVFGMTVEIEANDDPSIQHSERAKFRWSSATNARPRSQVSCTCYRGVLTSFPHRSL